MSPETAPAGDVSPQAPPAGGNPTGFVGELRAVVTGSVQHHAPCVPECPVCYPVPEKE